MKMNLLNPLRKNPRNVKQSNQLRRKLNMVALNRVIRSMISLTLERIPQHTV
jgi:hypothetical protein